MTNSSPVLLLEDPSEWPEWFTWVGHLHPVVLHVPIGMFAALALVEVLGMFKRARHTGLRRTLLWCTALSALAASTAGWMLHESRAGESEVAHRHEFASLVFTFLLIALAIVDSVFRGRRWAVTVRVLGLFVAGGALAVAGHLGGTMTHGRGFATKHGPAWLADMGAKADAWLLPPAPGAGAPDAGGEPDAGEAGAEGGEPSQVETPSVESPVFAVLDKHCISCHGPDKQKGDLRLDQIDLILEHVDPGYVMMSGLTERVLLAPSDADVMPPEDEPRLTPTEIGVLVEWVRNGAPREALAASLEAAAQNAATATASLAEVGEATGARITTIPVATGAEDAPESLRADFAQSPAAPNASRLAALAPIADRLAELSLAGQPVGDAALADLPDLPALRRVHLENTQVGDAAVRALVRAAPGLEYLNLHSTGVTAAVLEIVEGFDALRRLVLFGTDVDAAAIDRFRASHPDVEVTAALDLPPALEPEQRARRILAADASKRRIALVREIAIGVYEVEWEHPVQQIHDLHLLDNGNVLFQETWTRLVEVDPKTDEVVWSYDAATQNRDGAPGPVEIHAFGRVGDDVTFLAESGPGRIIEVGRGGKLLHQIPLQVAAPDPHHDTRLVRRTASGTYLVAHEAEGVVREYARDGAVVWDYAVPLFDLPRKNGHGPDAWGNQVFAALRLPNGNTLVTTGNGHRVLEVAPNRQIVWQLEAADVPGLKLGWITTVQVLASGNLVVGNCHAGPEEPQLFEVTRDKTVCWTFRDFEHFGNSLSNSLVVEGAH